MIASGTSSGLPPPDEGPQPAAASRWAGLGAPTGLCLGLLLLALLLVPRGGHGALAPNVIVILSDDQGYGDVSYSGLATDIETPNLDALASEGMRFNNFYANSAVCSPSRASLMTGRYPGLVGVPGLVRRNASVNLGFFNPNGPTLPELLKSAGYTTALVGKWHLGDRLGAQTPNLPTRRGFDLFRGWLGSAMNYFTHESTAKTDWPGDDLMLNNETVIPPKTHSGIHGTALFTDWAVEYIHDHSAGPQPFFLYLAYNAPHTPVQPPPAWLDRVIAREPGINKTRAGFVAQIEYMDDQIGRVVQALKTDGIYDNTLILFLSDNGGDRGLFSNNGPYRGGKLNLYEGGLRVPMFAVWPGTIAPGTQTQETALTMDIYPTLAEAVGVPIEHEIDGRSFLPVLLGQVPALGGRDLYFERMAFEDDYKFQTLYATRRGQWKLVQYTPVTPFELYDLSTDPGEREDLAFSLPEKVAELLGSLGDYTAREARIPFQPPLKLEHGVVGAVDGAWRRVSLGSRFRSPVLIASPQYATETPPLVTRVRGIADRTVDHDSFEIRLARADGLSDPVPPTDVRYLALEEGVYTTAHQGLTLEAFKFDSDTVDDTASWLGTQRHYANDYSAPVVVGQLLTHNDPRFSVFWSRGALAANAPDGNALYVGRHVGQDPNTTRATETVGYAVLEHGLWGLQGQTLLAGLGPPTVGGYDGTPPYTYPLQGLDQVFDAVVSQAGMRGPDGSWAALYGPDALCPAGLGLVMDEDQLGDDERAHGSERAAYLVFGSGPARPAAAMPLIPPAGGMYTAPVEVSLRSDTQDATIHFTLDGSAPTAASQAYQGPITLTHSATLKAVAVAASANTSPVASHTFRIHAGGSTAQTVPSAADPAAPAETATLTSAATLEAALASPPASVQLSAEGTLDWVHWGLNDRNEVDRKLGVPPRIRFQTHFYSAPRSASLPSPTFSWTDGMPTATALIDSAIILRRPSNGFLLRTPATGSRRTLRVYFQVSSARVRIDAMFSDGSLPPFTRTLAVPDKRQTRVLEVGFDHPGSGVELIVTARSEEAYGAGRGGITLAAATLSAAGPTHTLPAPVITPAGGTFHGPVSVDLEGTDPGAVLYYRTGDGRWSRYRDPFTLNQSAKVQALATLSGYNASPPSQAKFTLLPGDGGTGQRPFPGSPIPLPGVVEAEDYDLGGEGVAYHDTTPGNPGGAYRDDDVDIWNLPAGGHLVGANARGEWREYTVDPGAGGDHRLDIRVATPRTGARVHFEVEGTDLTGPIEIPVSGDWGVWQTVSVPLTLAAGPQVMRMVVDGGGFNIDRFELRPAQVQAPVATPTVSPPGGTFTGSVTIGLATATPGARIFYTTDGSTADAGAIPYEGPFVLRSTALIKAIAMADGLRPSEQAPARFTLQPLPDPGQRPLNGTPAPVPGVVEAEDYDLGGEGIAYHDTTAGNQGGVYRQDDVDIWDRDTGPGEDPVVGANASGEWREYTLAVGMAGEYLAGIEVTTPRDDALVRLEFDGQDLGGPIAVPNTGGWNSWQTITVPVTLNAGTQVMRFVVARGGLNISRIQLAAVDPRP